MAVTPASSNLGNARAILLRSHFIEWVDAALLIDQEIDDSAEKKARKSKKEDGQDAGAEKNTKKKAVAAAT